MSNKFVPRTTQGGSQNKIFSVNLGISKTGMTLKVLQEISKQKYEMNLLKQKIYMRENIDISCKRFQEMSIYSFSGQIKYEDFFHNQDLKICQRIKKAL